MVKIDKKIVSVRLGDSNIKKVQNVLATDVPMPTDAHARMKTLRAEGKKWYVTVVYHPDSELPFAIFCNTNNKEKTVQTSDAMERLLALARKSGILESHITDLESKIASDNNVNKITRSISLLLRHRVPINLIVLTLDQMETVFVGSFLFQIKKFLAFYVKDGEEVVGAKCDECGGHSLVYSEGCMTCKDCGNSKCG